MTTFETVAAHPALAEFTMQQMHQSNEALRALFASLFAEPRSPEEVRELLGPTEQEHSADAL